jgi:hypothetical protein
MQRFKFRVADLPCAARAPVAVISLVCHLPFLHRFETMPATTSKTRCRAGIDP